MKVLEPRWSPRGADRDERERVRLVHEKSDERFQRITALRKAAGLPPPSMTAEEQEPERVAP
jgi:hypothetical protein